MTYYFVAFGLAALSAGGKVLMVLIAAISRREIVIENGKITFKK